MPTGCYARPLDYGAIVRERLARARTQGRRIGRPRVAERATARCRACGVIFSYQRYPGKPERVCCSQACARQVARWARQVLPTDPAVLRQLYVTEGRTTTEIGAQYGVTETAVRRALLRAGIPRRRACSRPVVECIEEGCHAPPERRRHATNGSVYGRRCAWHQREHHRALGRDAYARRRGDPVAHELRRRARRRGHDVVLEGPERVRCIRPGCDRPAYLDATEGLTGPALVGRCRGVGAPRRRAA